MELNKKQALLEATKIQLKQEFVGLDEIIDRVIKLMTPWFLYPQLQKRPKVINLWGLTGVGKTSLVKRIVSLLEFQLAYYHFDMGHNSEQHETLRGFLKDINRHEQCFPFVIALDEFQHANTIAKEGNEIDKNHLRVVWDLLDSGKFQEFRSNSGLFRKDLAQSIQELRYLIKKGVVVENGVVTNNIEYYLKVTKSNRNWKDGFDEEVEVAGEGDRPIRKVPMGRLIFVKEDVLDEVFATCEDIFEHRLEVRDHLLKLSGPETIAFLEEMEAHSRSRKEVDCSKALVFVLGNLDEAFGIAGVMNPDIDADEFHKLTKRITVPHIKTSLQQRFRNEQIARLGNNHIIYPALSKASYKAIIQKELGALAAQTKELLGVGLQFDKTIMQIVYKEGVYPSQGTRPLYSTLQQLVEANLALLPVLLEPHKDRCRYILVRYAKGQLQFKFFDEKNRILQEYSETVNLQLENLRQSKNDELQAVTAVHESGHAVACIALSGIIPEQIFSVSSDFSMTGFVLTSAQERMVWSKEAIIQRAAVCLAGQAAEQLVFGEDNITAGAESDIRTANSLIVRLVKKQGLAGAPLNIELEQGFNIAGVFDSDYYYNDLVKKHLHEAQSLAKKVLTEHRPLLIALSQYLSTRSTISRNRLKALIRKHAPGLTVERNRSAYREKLKEAIQHASLTNLVAA